VFLQIYQKISNIKLIGNKLERDSKSNDSFIVYYDDDDTKKEIWVHLIDVKDGFVNFLTQSKDQKNRNKLSIPISRVLKIKTKEADSESTASLL